MKPTRPFHHDWRNFTIAGLIALVAILAALLLKGEFREGFFFPRGRSGTPVEVLEVSLDRDGRQFVDVVFGSRLGEDHVGEILVDEPAKITPPIGGSWTWYSPAVLRFEATSPFAPATEYLVILEPAQLLQKDQYLAGDQVFRVVTDRFRIDHVEIKEHPLSGGEITLQGEIVFNYPVSQKELTGQLQLVDESGTPVGFMLESPPVSEAVRLRTEPIKKQVEERRLEMRIAEGLTPSGGNVKLGTPYTRTILIGSNTRLAVREVTARAQQATSEIELLFSSSVDPDLLREYLSLDPAVDLDMRAELNQVWLHGALQPGESYKLSIREGLRAEDSSTLEEPFQRTVRIPDLEPTVRFKHQGLFLSSSGYRNLVIEAVNTSTAELVIDRIYFNNIFALVQHFGYQYQQEIYWGGTLPPGLGERLLEKSVSFQITPNKKLEATLNLERLIDPDAPGLYRVALRRPGQYRGEQRWILISDLGMVAKRGQGDLFVAASSFRNLQAVSGARIELISDKNQILDSGRTDSAGLWRGHYDPAEQPFLITLEKGEDRSFLLLPQSRVDTSGLDVAGATTSPAEGYQAFFYGERDLYRPGEEVKGIVLIRDSERRPAPRMPLVLTHLDPGGREREKMTLPMTGPGLAEFAIKTRPYDLTGNRLLQVKVADRVVGQYRFQLEDFVPDRIRTDIQEMSVEESQDGQELAFQVQAAYLFGAPAASLPAEVRVFLEPSGFSDPDYATFTFGNAERKFNRQSISENRRELDPQGLASFRVSIPRGLRPPAALTAVVTARVQEQGGRGVTATRRHPVHVYSNYLGLRSTGKGTVEPGQAASFEYVSLSPQGESLAPGPLKLEIYRDLWQTVLRRTASGTFRYESVRSPRLVHSRDLSERAASGSFTFTPDELGSYRVVLEDTSSGSSSQLSFYASGWGYSPWAIENPARLELELEEEEYRPGDTAQVHLRAPFSGRLLLTLETNRVHYARTYQLDGNTATLSFPVEASYSPNAYVTATLVRSVEDLGTELVSRAYGAIPIFVDRARHRLPVSIDVAETARPGSDLKIQVSTRPGATVTVAAVDEGILQLIAQATPDPYEFFYRKLRLDVSTHDIFSMLLPDTPEIEGISVAGGGADRLRETQMVRTESLRRREPVSFWSGLLEADERGLASTTFTLPEFQGALRVMAVSSKIADFGSRSEVTRVRSPILLMPTFPRFLAPGDHFEIPVSIRNDTGRDGTFELRMKLSGQGSLTGEPTIRAEVPSSGEQTVYFEADSADETGEIEFLLSASGNGESSTHSEALTVRPALPTALRHQSGAVDSARLELHPPASGLMRSTVETTLTLGPLPVTNFTANLTNLLRYPYGCLEQTTSRILPLIYFPDMIRSLQPDFFAATNPATIINSGLRQLIGMQLLSGGFGMWPGSSQINPWASAYATHALVEARRAGFHVDDDFYGKALRFLDSQARTNESKERAGVEQLVYSLYILARAGQPERGQMDYVNRDLQEFLRPSSRALLGATYALTGNQEVAASLLKSLEEVEEVERSTGKNFDSTTRNRALLLLALLESAPQDPRIPSLFDRLARDASAARWTTQETSFAFLAIGQFARLQKPDAGYGGEVLVNGQSLGRFGPETSSFDLPAGDSLVIQMDEGFREGSAFYSLVTRGTPLAAGFEPEQEGLAIERQLRSRTGASVDLENIRQGDLIVFRTRIRSLKGPVENVVIQQLLPSGLEVENPRLQTTEKPGWMTGSALTPSYQDLRDDRVLFFTDLPANQWRTAYTLLRAVSPGRFQMPPVHAEAMYNPQLRVTGGRSEIQIRRHP